MTLPNGPQSPAFVQMLRWIFSPMSYMEQCAQRYGDIFTLHFSKEYPALVYVSNPQAMQQILTNDTKEDFTAPGDLNKLFESLLGKHSVISLSGAEHQRQRHLMMPPFHGDRMRTYSEVINKVTEEIIDQWQIRKPFDVRSATQAITLRVIMQAVFGLYEGDRAQKLEQLISELLDKASNPFSVVMLYFPILQQNLCGVGPWARQTYLHRQVDELLYAEIRERREKADTSRTDILSLLMAAKDEAGESMTDEELHDELITLLVAGHETTATALTWALYWIHKLPAVRAKLVEEIDSLGANPDANAIFKLPYLGAVCNETLRIYPVGMLTFPRVVKKPLSLAGHKLEPGTVVMGSIYLIHHREDLYPEPKQFKPERFLERQFSPFEFLPFGGGARRCIGAAFAMFEMKLALAKILSRVELELADNREVTARRRGLVTAPARSVRMVVKSQREVKSRTLESVAG